MIDRRGILRIGAGLGAALATPASAQAIFGTETMAFDLIDDNALVEGGLILAPQHIRRGEFLHRSQVRQRMRTDLFVALLSPANAVLLTEMERFERSISIIKPRVSSPGRAMTADARILVISPRTK